MHTVVCGSLLAGEKETKSRAKQDVAIGVLDVKCELVEARRGDSNLDDGPVGQRGQGTAKREKERKTNIALPLLR
jgi:hypothetical protein